MKTALALVLVIASATAVSAKGGGSHGYGYSYGTGSNPSSHYVQPHYNSNGSYTGGHYQTNPNSTTLDNYGTRGNYNPYTGQYGTHDPD